MRSEEFLCQLQERRVGRGTQIREASIWEAFLATFPGLATELERRQRLVQLLNALEQAGAVALPKGRPGWDHSVQPPCPRWLKLPRKDLAEESPDPRHLPWAHELAFVASLDRVVNLDELLAIQRFLASGGRERPLVPVRERSVELFGAEKRLDALAKGSLFGAGRLDLEILRCFSVAPPLAWEAGPPGKAIGQPVLVIENLHTYHSLCRWNERVGSWAAVVYGNGNAFARTVTDLGRILSLSKASLSVEYFGDLDAAGLAIPRLANQTALSLGLPAITPAERLYDLLLQRGEQLDFKQRDRGQVSPEALAWLPPRLRDQASPWAEAGLRLAQELVGWEVLSSLGSLKQSFGASTC